jgi:hypothetical protein
MSRLVATVQGVLRTTLIVAASLHVVDVLRATLEFNQRAGVYPAQGDSIIIPLAEQVIVTAMLLPCYLFIAIVPITRWLRPRPAGRSRVQLVLLVGLGGSYACVMFQTLAVVARWAVPNHYSVAKAAGAACVLLAGLFVLDLVQLARRGLFRRPARPAPEAAAPPQAPEV